MNDFVAKHPIKPDDFKTYPGSSKGPNPEDNPEHFKLWMAQNKFMINDEYKHYFEEVKIDA